MKSSSVQCQPQIRVLNLVLQNPKACQMTLIPSSDSFTYKSYHFCITFVSLSTPSVHTFCIATGQMDCLPCPPTTPVWHGVFMTFSFFSGSDGPWSSGDTGGWRGWLVETTMQCQRHTQEETEDMLVSSDRLGYTVHVGESMT